MSDETANNWYAAQLKPNALSVAERNLKRQGFRTFCPKRFETQDRGNHYSQKLKPLFPGYVFIQFDPDGSPWRRVNSTFGITRLVADGRGYPVPLPAHFMTSLLIRCSEDEIFTDITQLAAGTEVQIIQGPFAQQIAKIDAAGPEGRIIILLEIMGQVVKASVPNKSVEPRIS